MNNVAFASAFTPCLALQSSLLKKLSWILYYLLSRRPSFSLVWWVVITLL